MSPALPQAGEPIEALVLLGLPLGFCINPSPNVQGQVFDVTQDDDLVILDVSTPLVACLPTTPLYTQLPFSLGQLSAGQYRLQFNTVFPSTSFPASANDRSLQGEIEFEVVPAIEAIPVNSVTWLMLFIFGLVFIGALYIKFS